MNTHKELGKISAVRFGIGGYNDSMFGLYLTLSGTGWGVGTDVNGGWCYGIVDPGPNSKWTEEDRQAEMAEMCKRVAELLRDAKVDSVHKLLDKPIEATFEGMLLKDWRILTEVL